MGILRIVIAGFIVAAALFAVKKYKDFKEMAVKLVGANVDNSFKEFEITVKITSLVPFWAKKAYIEVYANDGGLIGKSEPIDIIINAGNNVINIPLVEKTLRIPELIKFIADKSNYNVKLTATLLNITKTIKI